MTDAEKLTLLKSDLQMLTSSNDAYLQQLIAYSKAQMIEEGITYIENDITCDTLNIQYAAYLFRRRAGTETSMPRYLRYGLNNLLFSQKGAVNDV